MACTMHKLDTRSGLLSPLHAHRHCAWQVASIRSAHIYHNVRLDSRGQLVEALDLSSNCWLEMMVEWQE